MFGIGMPELILILVIALIVIGPKKLPDLAKSLGKALGEFKKATSDLKDSIDIDTDLKEVKDTFGEVRQDLQDTLKKGLDEAAVPPPAAKTAAADENDMDRDKTPGPDAGTADNSVFVEPQDSRQPDGNEPNTAGGDSAKKAPASEKPGTASSQDSAAVTADGGPDRHG